MPVGRWRKTTVSMRDLYDFMKYKGNHSPNRNQLDSGYSDYCRYLLKEKRNKSVARGEEYPFFYSFVTRFIQEDGGPLFLNEGVAGEIYEFESNKDRAIYEEIVLKNGALDEFIGNIESKKYRYGE